MVEGRWSATDSSKRKRKAVRWIDFTSMNLKKRIEGWNKCITRILGMLWAFFIGVGLTIVQSCISLVNKIQKIYRSHAAEDRVSQLPEDRMSHLPDDILVSIISRLTLREAIITSVLSTRWRDLYTYINHLRFPRLELSYYSNFRRYNHEVKLLDYINMVNHTLDSYKGSGVLKEFRVHMNCFEGFNIERWLKFALAREVEIINMLTSPITVFKPVHCALRLSNLIRMNGGQMLPGLRRLRELSLCGVDVDDQEVELLLSNSPFLESLSISCSKTLRNVSIVGYSVLKLKHLDISFAKNLESIKIEDMVDLVSLRCYGHESKYILHLDNVPKLTEFSTSEHGKSTLTEFLTQIPSYIRDQLQLIKLWTRNFLEYYTPTYELINVKHLELEVIMKWNHSTWKTSALIEACSSLEKLEIKFLWGENDTNFEEREVFMMHPTKTLSPNLKTLRLSGYLGCPSELEFAFCILKNVAALEELIVEPCNLTGKIRRMAARRARKHFRPRKLKSVNLIII